MTLIGSRHETRVVLLALAAISALAWGYLVFAAGSPADMPRLGEAMASVRAVPWGPVDVMLTTAMWSVMMVAMMLPSASPVVTLFAKTLRRSSETGTAVTLMLRVACFVSGYLAVWTAFSVGATLAQWLLHAASLSQPLLTSPAAPAGEELRSGLAGAILIAAGLYQFSLLKDVCLRHCQSPLGFFMTHWREGNLGAFRLGLAHGAYCLGCCWALMGLLFVVGVMNLVWVAALSVFVVVEKCLAHGRPRVPRVAGFALIGWGLAVVVW